MLRNEGEFVLVDLVVYVSQTAGVPLPLLFTFVKPSVLSPDVIVLRGLPVQVFSQSPLTHEPMCGMRCSIGS